MTFEEWYEETASKLAFKAFELDAARMAWNAATAEAEKRAKEREAEIGNVLDHWEQLPNDLRGDPGFKSLDATIKEAVRQSPRRAGGETDMIEKPWYQLLFECVVCFLVDHKPRPFNGPFQDCVRCDKTLKIEWNRHLSV